MTDTELVEILRTLGQVTRLKIVRLLNEESMSGLSAGYISATVEIAPALASFHLKELHRAGILEKDVEGRFAIYSLNKNKIGLLTNLLVSG